RRAILPRSAPRRGTDNDPDGENTVQVVQLVRFAAGLRCQRPLAEECNGRREGGDWGGEGFPLVPVPFVILGQAPDLIRGATRGSDVGLRGQSGKGSAAARP